MLTTLILPIPLDREHWGGGAKVGVLFRVIKIPTVDLKFIRREAIIREPDLIRESSKNRTEPPFLKSSPISLSNQAVVL